MQLSQELQCSVGMLLDLMLRQAFNATTRLFAKDLQAYVSKEVHSQEAYKKLLKFVHPQRCPVGQDYQGKRLVQLLEGLKDEGAQQLRQVLEQVLKEYRTKKLNSAIVQRFLKKFYDTHNEIIQNHLELFRDAKDFVKIKKKYAAEAKRVLALREALFGRKFPRLIQVTKKAKHVHNAKHKVLFIENNNFKHFAENICFILKAYPEYAALLGEKMFSSSKEQPFIQIATGQHDKLELQFLAHDPVCAALFDKLSTTLALAGIEHQVRQDMHMEPFGAYYSIAYKEHAPACTEEVAALFAKRHHLRRGAISPDLAVLRFQLYRALDQNGFVYQKDFSMHFSKKHDFNIVCRQRELQESISILIVLRDCLQAWDIQSIAYFIQEEEQFFPCLKIVSVHKLSKDFFEAFEESLLKEAPAEIAWKAQYRRFLFRCLNS